MSSVVDICNLALAHFGDSAAVSSISPPDGSAQASHCARFYPMALDALLEAHAWPFATVRVALAETNNTAHQPWLYEYAQPNSCARILSILSPGMTDDAVSLDYVAETAANGDLIILTDATDAIARYTKRVTDPSKFSASFVNALSFLLGSYLAGPITKDKAVVAGLYQRYQKELADARALAANIGQAKAKHAPPWLAARGIR